MPDVPPTARPPDSQLEGLKSAVRAARRDVDLRRSGKVDPAQLVTARGVLLEALESLAAELARLRLPIPPTLRDDLRLQRRIRGGRRLR